MRIIPNRLGQIALAGLLGIGAATPADAATDGVVAANSTGRLAISMNQPKLIRIGALDNLVFGTWTGTGNLTRDSLHCVGTNSSTRRFRITASGSGPGGLFRIQNGTNQLTYTVQYRDSSGANVALTANVARTNRLGTTFTSCNSGAQPHRLRVQITAANMAAAPAGNYSGTLTLVVQPE